MAELTVFAAPCVLARLRSQFLVKTETMERLTADATVDHLKLEQFRTNASLDTQLLDQVSINTSVDMLQEMKQGRRAQHQVNINELTVLYIKAR